MDKTYFYILVIVVLILSAQINIFSQNTTTWYKDDRSVWSSAMAGGFMAPQFSSFDLNKNGHNEMIVFDRFSGVISVWSQNEGSIQYFLQDNLNIDWPVIQSWMLVRDFNNDGIPDLFTQGYHGIAVYKGFSENGKIWFDKMTGPSFVDDSLEFETDSGTRTNIFHAASDIPVIEDVDGDGDLDIMTFELSGSYLYYYENRSEKTGKPLDFKLKHSCWGHFAENQLSDEIKLSNAPLGCPPPFSLRHVGSSSCFIDVNGDSIPDMLLGDIGNKSLKVLLNSGTPEDGFIESVEPVFPGYTTPAILHDFPAAFSFDIDQDQREDVVIAHNDYPADDTEGIFVYRATGDSSRPFEFQTSAWLADQFIDLGQYSAPLFININGDDIPDLLVAYTVSENREGPRNKIAYFEAISENQYQLITKDFHNLSEVLIHGYRPYLTSGDVDKDGDQDILIGMSSGEVYLLKNESGHSHRFDKGGVVEDWAGLTFLSGAAPELYDMDMDGDLDIIVGSDNGTLTLYVNSGSEIHAAYNSDPNQYPNIRNLGRIRTIQGNSLLGSSTPRILNVNDQVYLLAGSRQGYLYSYKVNFDDLTSSFKTSEIDDLPSWIGRNGRITLNPGAGSAPLLMAGNIAGGLREFRFNVLTKNNYNNFDSSISISPNPVFSGELFRIVSSSKTPDLLRVKVYGITGQLHKSFKEVAKEINIYTEGWYPGVYFVEIKRNNETFRARKIVVQ